jgi:3'(2'), 5'-bisphosphate nucleotidase
MSFSESQMTTPLGEWLSKAFPMLTDFAVCQALLQICEGACGELLEFYHRLDPVDVAHKADKSPVTEVDHALHERLSRELTHLLPGIPVLSEESSMQDIAARQEWETCWLIDPLDGTREFIQRSGEFSINVALIHRGRPLLGIISCPSEAAHYLGVPGWGAWRAKAHRGVITHTELIVCSPLAHQAGVTNIASVRHHPDIVAAVQDALGHIAPDVSRINAGAAIKFCRLIEGDGDVYARTSPCYEWDVAAGDALVTAAGGKVIDLDGDVLHYNQRGDLLAPRFIAQADPTIDYLSALRPTLLESL